MSEHDPGDEDRSDRDVCPFCGRNLNYARAMITTVFRRSYQPTIDGEDWLGYEKLLTCRAQRCIDSASAFRKEHELDTGARIKRSYLRQLARRAGAEGWNNHRIVGAHRDAISLEVTWYDNDDR